MNIIPYIYALLNGHISCEDFVNWTFTDNIANEFDSDILDKIQSCDCENSNDTAELKKLLAKHYGKPLCNVTASCLSECSDNTLKMMLIYSGTAKKLCVDFSNISTAAELHKCLRYAFHLPYWYGENFDAFADILDMSEYKIIVLFNFTALENELPHAAAQLMNIIDKSKNSDSVVIFT